MQSQDLQHYVSMNENEMCMLSIVSWFLRQGEFEIQIIDPE